MIKVEFFGLYRLEYKMKSWETEASSIVELFEKLHAFNSLHTPEALHDAIVFVNDKNIMSLKKHKTKLKDGDVVWIMSPASGG